MATGPQQAQAIMRRAIESPLRRPDQAKTGKGRQKITPMHPCPRRRLTIQWPTDVVSGKSD